MGPDTTYLHELLDGQLAFLLAQDDDVALLSVPAFLQALRREPQISIHLDDLRVEADELGRELQEVEYDGGNPGQLVQLAWEELGQKLPRGPALAALGDEARQFTRLLGEMNYPFVLPLPSASRAKLGRVDRLLATIDKLKTAAAPTPILEIESSGFDRMVRRNSEVQQRARLRTRGDPSVALLRLEAAEHLALRESAFAESSPRGDRPKLRVEADPYVVQQTRSVGDELRSPASQGALRPVVEDLHRSAQIVFLELRRRLYTARSRLGVVLRFKARCEWHDRERLRGLADAATEARRAPEHALRDQLTLYLFDQGLNPLAEAVLGTSSRADVFDPTQARSFYVEAKQYADRTSLDSELRAAFRQALDTIGSLPGSGYFADEAFVVLFRRGGPRVVLPTEPLSAEGLRWYFVLINIAEASQDASQNRETPEEYTAERLREMLFELRSSGSRGSGGTDSG